MISFFLKSFCDRINFVCVQVNESLLAMSFVSSDNGDCNVNSDTLNNGDNLIIDTDGGSANKGG